MKYVQDGTFTYRTALLFNGATITLGANNLEEEGYFNVVQRSCNDSNSPGVTCELLQVTVNGKEFFRDQGHKLRFAVFVGSNLHYISGNITVLLTGKYHQSVLKLL